MAIRRPRHRLARRGPQRESYDRVLILCEGKKTEPSYFSDLLAHYRLSMANIEIVGSGTDPRTVVKQAKKRRLKEIRNSEKYDRVYCVFDRDEHATFDKACEEASASGITPIRSWPCFEFWLVLHFRYSRQPYARSGGRSAAQNCVVDVRQHLPGYAKATRGVFGRLEDSLEQANANAARALTDAEATEEFNPSTEIHLLVDYLQALVPDRG